MKIGELFAGYGGLGIATQAALAIRMLADRTGATTS